MATQTHFETLASGMKAKLDTRLGAHNNYVSNLKKSYVNRFSIDSLEEMLEKHRPTPVVETKKGGRFNGFRDSQ